MNIPLIIIAALILFMAHILNGAPTRPDRTYENRTTTLRNNRAQFSSCLSNIHDKLLLNKEQLTALERLTNELRDMRKVTTESLDKNRKKIHDALSKENGRPEAEQLLAQNSAMIQDYHKKEMDMIVSVQSVLDEKQKKRLQRIKDERLDDEEQSENSSSMRAFSMILGENSSIPSILPPEEAELLGINGGVSLGLRKALTLSSPDNADGDNFDFNFDFSIPDGAEEDSNSDKPRMDKKHKELERSMRNLEKRLQEMEKQIQRELEAEMKEDEI